MIIKELKEIERKQKTRNMKDKENNTSTHPPFAKGVRGIVPQLRFPEFKENSYIQYSFKEIFIFSTGKNIKQNESSPEFKIPCVRYGELYHMYNEVIREVINKTNLNKSELLFSDGDEILLPSAGEDPLDISLASALTIKNVAIGRTINILKPLKINIYSQIYVSYYINEKLRKNISSLAKGMTISNVYNSDLKTLKISLPSIKEQTKIADCLLSLDELINLQNKKLESLKQHKKGLMQDLFPAEGETVPKLRFPEFSDDWENEYLDNLTTKISDGIHTTPIYDDSGEYYFINGNNLVNGIILLDEKTKRVSEEEYRKHKRDLTQNTILLSINGTIGNISIYNNEKVILGKSACYINIDSKKCDKDFIIYFLQTEKNKNYFDSELTGSTIKNLSLKTIKNTNINLPTFSEQTKIADCLSSLDGQITLQNKKLEALKEHKKGLMQQLFPSVDEVNQ